MAISRKKFNQLSKMERDDLTQAVYLRNISPKLHLYFAWQLSNYILEQENISHADPAFRNRQGSYASWPGNHGQLVFGYQDLDDIFTGSGFCEYVAVRWVWEDWWNEETNGRPVIKGLSGIWAVVLHEVTHLIQRHRLGPQSWAGRNQHNRDFQLILKELIDKYPKYSCFELFNKE